MKLWDNARTGPSSWASLAIWGSGQPTRVVEPKGLEPVVHQGRKLHLLEVDVCPDQGLRGTVVLPLKKGFDDHRGGPGVDAMKEVRLKPVPRRGFCRKKPNCWLATDDGRAPRFDRTARFDDLPRTDLGFLDAYQRAATNDEVLLPAPHAWFTREPTIVPLLQPLVQCTSPKTGTTSLVVVRPNACDEQHARRFALRLPAPDPEHRFSIAVVTPRDDDRACDAQLGWSFDPDRLLPPEPLRESALEFPPCADLPRGNWQSLTPVTDPAKLPYREALRGEIRTALLTGDAVVLTPPA